MSDDFVGDRLSPPLSRSMRFAVEAVCELVKMATEEERERCAKIAENFRTDWPNDAVHIAEAIRKATER